MSRTVPPYTGEEPYLFLCFSEKSTDRVRDLLRRLPLRGVRVWYCAGTPPDRAEREETDRRMRGARLTAVYLDETFRSDPAAKSRLLTCQRDGKPIVCLNMDDGDGGLSIGLHDGAQEIRLRRASAEEAETALLHAEGFSRELIGEPAAAENRRFRSVIAILIVLSILALAAGALRLVLNRPSVQESTAPPQTETPTDPVRFSDEGLCETVRAALGGGVLTEERLREITVLRLPGDVLPDDLSDLSLLPSLETLELSQTAASAVPDHPELSGYTIVLFGGGSE